MDCRQSTQNIAQNHDSILKEQLERIWQLVSKNRLAVVAVEIGRIFELPMDDPNNLYIENRHKLMQAITGLQDDRHVCQVKNSAEIFKLFSFIPSLLTNGAEAEKAVYTNEMDLRGF